VSAPRTVVYTDGACAGNPGPGGWAWAVPNGRYESGAEERTTNQRMEITAALQAVTSLPGLLLVMSDSTYVVNCFRDRWWEGWVARGWKTSARKPVANRDLWEPLIDAYRADRGRLEFRWVKGHGDDAMNDLVDRLAVEAAARQVGRTGFGAPAHLGPVDLAAGRQGDGRVPSGHLVTVTGLKPPELGGYDDNPVVQRLRDRLTEIISAKRELQPDLTVLTGLGLGAEQLGAEAAQRAGVPFVGVLAFPGTDELWPAASRDRFATLLAGACSQILLQQKKPASRQAAGGAFARRDAWLARNSAEAIVVWDGEDATVGRTVRSFQDRLGEAEVWIVDPR
jgi:ribonuclease HI